MESTVTILERNQLVSSGQLSVRTFTTRAAHVLGRAEAVSEEDGRADDDGSAEALGR